MLYGFRDANGGGHPDHALMLIVSYYEDSAQVLCSICQMQGEVSLGKVLNASPCIILCGLCIILCHLSPYI